MWLANRSLSTQIYTDHGLYYMNGIRWATDYRIVPGLANLHHRLAFNNSNFLLHAMLELGGWRNYTAHIVNGFLAAMAVPIIVQGFSAAVAGRGRERQLGWFAVALAMIVAVSAVDRRISSAHPDFAAAMLVTVAAWRLLAIQLLEAESERRAAALQFARDRAARSGRHHDQDDRDLLCRIRGRRTGSQPLSARKTLWIARPVRSVATHLAFMLPWVVVVFLPWMVRGYILSGYPLFPGTIAGAPVDWIYPAEDAAELRRVIYAWSRAAYFNIELGFQPGWGWVPHWLVQVILLRGPVEAVLPVLISAACLVQFFGGSEMQSDDCGDNGSMPSSVVRLAVGRCVRGQHRGVVSHRAQPANGQLRPVGSRGDASGRSQPAGVGRNNCPPPAVDRSRPRSAVPASDGRRSTAS